MFFSHVRVHVPNQFPRLLTNFTDVTFISDGSSVSHGSDFSRGNIISHGSSVSHSSSVSHDSSVSVSVSVLHDDMQSQFSLIIERFVAKTARQILGQMNPNVYEQMTLVLEPFTTIRAV